MSLITSAPSTTLGALTTVFTPQPFCTTDIWAAPGGGYLLGPYLNSSCLPSGYNPTRGAVYSPGVCPNGYTEACRVQRTDGIEATCCPSGFLCNPDSTAYPWYSTLKCTSNTPDKMTVPALVSSDQAVTSRTATLAASADGLNAYGIAIKYKAADRTVSSITSTSATLSSTFLTSSAAPSSTMAVPSPTPVHARKELSGVAKAGIAIGAIAGFALLFVILYILWRALFRTSGTVPIGGMDMSGGDAVEIHESNSVAGARRFGGRP